MEWRIVLLLILFKLLASINLYMDSALKRGTAFWEGEIGWHSSNQQSRILSWPCRSPWFCYPDFWIHILPVRISRRPGWICCLLSIDVLCHSHISARFLRDEWSPCAIQMSVATYEHTLQCIAFKIVAWIPNRSSVDRSCYISCAEQPGEWWAAESRNMAAPAVDLGLAMR